MSALKQIGHLWKPMNTGDLKLIWISPSIFFFSSSLIGLHKSEAGTTRKAHKGSKLQGLRLASVLGFWVIVASLPQGKFDHNRRHHRLKGATGNLQSHAQLLIYATGKFDLDLIEDEN